MPGDACAAERELPDGVIEFLKSAPKNAAPMDVMRTAVSMLGLYDPDLDKEETPEVNLRRARSITAKIGVIAAYFHRARQGKSLPPVRDDLGEAAHFLYLMCWRSADEGSGRHARCGFRAARRSRHECFDLQRARHDLDLERHLFRDHVRDRDAEGSAPRRRE